MADGGMSVQNVEPAEPHLIHELEGAFKNCIALLTSQEYFNVNDSEETKTSVEHSIQKFLELARKTEAFFLQKRFILSNQRPEQVVKEDIEVLKAELERKDQLLQKHWEKLQRWQSLSRMITNMPGQQATHPPAAGHQQQPGHGQAHPGVTHYPQGQGPPPAGASGLVMPPPQTPQMAPSYPQGPLAYLEQTMSSIGLPDRR